MKNLYKKAIQLHKKNKGKLETKSKVPLKNRRDLSLAYTPGVAEISRLIAKNKNLASTLSLKGNTVAVITDGSAILGLGNLGPEAALPVMEGKCILFKEFAGVDAFPICLNTQDEEEIIKTIKNIAPTFGGINLEDISAPRCFNIEKRLRAELDIPVVHDDQHGAATVVLAGLINALRVKKLSIKKARVVINGAGAAGIAITEILLDYGFKNIIVCDSEGAIYKKRKNLSPIKKEIAQKTNHGQLSGSLAEVIKNNDIFIGVSKSGVLSAEMIKTMNKNPIIFALANPIPEIMPEVAKKAGAFIVATGRSDYPNQINNVLAFPGIFRGALDNKIKKITNKMLIRAAKKLADLISKPSTHSILPDAFDKRVVKAVASAIF